MRGHRFDPLSGEIPQATEQLSLMCHNYWACALEPESRNYWANVLILLKPMHLELMLHNKLSHRSEKPVLKSEE